MSAIPRAEHPQPQFMRQSWVNLNGTWEFAFDDSNIGSKQQWHKGETALSQHIEVPFVFQSKLSGIADTDFHDIVWYRRALDIPEAFRGQKILLHFGAVDYDASVWVNGVLVASHSGGHTPFQADITHALKEADNWLVVKAVDYSTDLSLPRGKQYWHRKSASIFYTRTTGIWQTVWMEAVADSYVNRVQLTPNIDRHEIEVRTFLDGEWAERPLQLQIDISYEGEAVASDTLQVTGAELVRAISVRQAGKFPEERWWSPQTPRLYDLKLRLLDGGTVIDEVDSYFGMRKSSIEQGKYCLNNRPFFQRLVLDQGYFPEGILTAPSDDALRQDVELMKAMGFNGLRKHQKLEDPRFLYWCDKLGLVVWSEAANAYEYSETYARRFMAEWQESIARDINHPCIVVWVPLNESWGVGNIQIDRKQQQHALTMYHMTHSLDGTRPVVSNDGWEMATTDLFNIHDYEWRREVLEKRYSSLEEALKFEPAGRKLAVPGYPYAGQPLLVTEFGGIAYHNEAQEGWGYSGAVDGEDLLRRLRDVVEPLKQSELVQGFCYTQLTDVEQEVNGLLTYDRKPKVALDKIKEIIGE